MDKSFSSTCAYGSDKWIATVLGQSLEWFKRNRAMLEREGFPPKDTLFGMTLKADVQAFLAKRRRVNDPDPTATHHGPENSGVNYGHL